MHDVMPMPDPLPDRDAEGLASGRIVADRLVVSGVGHEFAERRTRTEALADVELSVPRGSFVSVIGPSGCGKSTLLRILAGLLQPSRGVVSIFGRPVADAVADKTIGFLPQSPALLPWRSVIDNVRLPLQINRAADDRSARSPRDPAELLRMFGLGKFLEARPDALSGGMQQRVALARALVFDPEILLMDEPFSALDELTRERHRHELLEVTQREGKTVVFVTHSVPEATLLSDAIAVMSSRPGRIHRVVPVDLPRPRRAEAETTAEFLRMTTAVRRELADAWVDDDD